MHGELFHLSPTGRPASLLLTPRVLLSAFSCFLPYPQRFARRRTNLALVMMPEHCRECCELSMCGGKARQFLHRMVRR